MRSRCQTAQAVHLWQGLAYVVQMVVMEQQVSTFPLSNMASTMHMSAPAQCRCGTAPRAAQAAKVLPGPSSPSR